MKRVLPILFSMLVLSFVSWSGAFAGTEATPVPAAPEVASTEPAVPPMAVSPQDGAIFQDAVSDTAYNVCCQGAFAVCAGNCFANVSSFTCTRLFPSGCRTECWCG